MKVYHGSRVIVERPDTIHSRKRVDSGKGFYVTPIFEQAKNLCRRFLSVGQDAYISCYELDDAIFEADEVKKLIFDSYTGEWLDFIIGCRKGSDSSDHDIVMGGVADDKVFDTVELYFQNMISKDEALKRLKYEKPNFQICIRTQKVIERYLHYEGSEKL